MKHGIYVVDVDDGNFVGQTTRVVVYAVDAAEAEVKAAAVAWPAASFDERANMIEQGRVRVGRIGTYDPGITGAQMTSLASCVAVQRMGQR